MNESKTCRWLVMGCSGGSGLPNCTALRTNHHPARTTDGTTSAAAWSGRIRDQKRTTTSASSSTASSHTVSLASTASATANPAPSASAIAQDIALQHDDSGEHEQRAREPREVVVVDRAGEVLRLREQRDQRGGPDRQSQGAIGKQTASDRVDGENREHAERHREQADEARIAAGELRESSAPSR